MDHAPIVGVLDGLGDARDQCRGAVEGHRAGLDQRREGLPALDQVHDQEVAAVLHPADAVHVHDLRVPEPRQGPCLGDEPPHPTGRVECLAMHQLDRHGLSQTLLKSLEDLAHPPRAERTQELEVGFPQGGVELARPGQGRGGGRGYGGVLVVGLGSLQVGCLGQRGSHRARVGRQGQPLVDLALRPDLLGQVRELPDVDGGVGVLVPLQPRQELALDQLESDFGVAGQRGMLGQVFLDRLGAAVSPAEELIEQQDLELLGGRGVGMVRPGTRRPSGRGRTATRRHCNCSPRVASSFDGLNHGEGSRDPARLRSGGRLERRSCGGPRPSHPAARRSRASSAPGAPVPRWRARRDGAGAQPRPGQPGRAPAARE